MAQTKEERAAYMRRYQERHAERLKAYQREWYEANRDQKIARSHENRQARKERLGENHIELRRISRNLRFGRSNGLTEDEAWQFAIACECELALFGKNALRGGRLKELIAETISLREANARIDERQTRWGAPAGDSAIVDDGYDEWEAA